MGLDPQQLSLLGVAIFLGGAGLRGLWVFGWTYKDKTADLVKMEADRDFWRDTALKALGHTDKALSIASGARDG